MTLIPILANGITWFPFDSSFTLHSIKQYTNRSQIIRIKFSISHPFPVWNIRLCMYVYICRQSKIPFQITFENCSTQISKWIKFNHFQSIGKCHRKYFYLQNIFLKFLLHFPFPHFFPFCCNIHKPDVPEWHIDLSTEYSEPQFKMYKRFFICKLKLNANELSLLIDARTTYTNGSSFLNKMLFCFSFISIYFDCCFNQIFFFITVFRWYFAIFSFAIGIENCDELIHDDSMIKPSDEVKKLSLLCVLRYVQIEREDNVVVDFIVCMPSKRDSNQLSCFASDQIVTTQPPTHNG